MGTRAVNHSIFVMVVFFFWLRKVAFYDYDEFHVLVAVFSTWRQMAGRLPREGEKNATKPRQVAF